MGVRCPCAVHRSCHAGRSEALLRPTPKLPRVLTGLGTPPIVILPCGSPPSSNTSEKVLRPRVQRRRAGSPQASRCWTLCDRQSREQACTGLSCAAVLLSADASYDDGVG
eukprot:4464945-Pleurochrysis_carterae.AAC.6